nr:hypothetical protein [Micromonospora sp. DSM 115978]
MQDAWRAYLELALGLTEASRKRAQTVARKLVGQSGATAAQLQGLAEDLLAAGLANREALTRIVGVEVDRALAAVGLATADEVKALTDRVARLERELAAAGAGAGSTTRSGAASPATAVEPVSATNAVAKKAAKKAVATKAVAKKAPAKKAVATKAVAKKAVAKKAVAKKAPTTPPDTGTVP